MIQVPSEKGMEILRSLLLNLTLAEHIADPVIQKAKRIEELEKVLLHVESIARYARDLGYLNGYSNCQKFSNADSCFEVELKKG